MTRRSVRFFVVAGLMVLCVSPPSGLAHAQADYSTAYAAAEDDLSAQTYAPNDFADGTGTQDDGVSGAGQSQQAWANSPFWVLSFEDREAIGRVAYAEAGNQGEEGIAAVIFTMNRVASGQFQDNIQGVIDAPNQFEPATRTGGWRYLPPLDLTQSIQFETILNLILAGWLPDLTQGALFYASIVAARAAAGKVSPYLVDFGGTPPVAEIGDHRFYDGRAAANLSALRWHSRAEDTYAVSAIESLPYEGGAEDQLNMAEPEAGDAPAWSDPYEGPAPAQDELPPG